MSIISRLVSITIVAFFFSAAFLLLAPIDQVSATTAGHGQFEPTADSYVDAINPTTNYGALTYIGDAWGPSQQVTAYLRWNLIALGVPSDATITGAWLNIYCYASTYTGYMVIYGSAYTDWSETGINYNNAPATDGGNYIGDDTLNGLGWQNWSTQDNYGGGGSVTETVKNSFDINGKAYIRLDGANLGTPQKTRSFYSREGTYHPYLYLEWTTTSTPPPVPDPFLPRPLTNRGTPVLHTVYGSNNVTPTADTYVSSSSPNNNYGTIDGLFVHHTAANVRYITMMRWNLTTVVPANSTLDGAWLHIRAGVPPRAGTEYWYGGGSVITPVDFDWVETTMTWNYFYPRYALVPPYVEVAENVAIYLWNNITVTTLASSFNTSHRVFLAAAAYDDTANYQGYYSKESAVSDPGLQVNWHYHYYTYLPTESQKYLGWLTHSGILTIMAAIGFIGGIAMPVIWYQKRETEGAVGFVWMIGLTAMFWGIFYACIAVFS